MENPYVAFIVEWKSRNIAKPDVNEPCSSRSLGRHCELPIDYCAQQGCNNSGTCVNERGYRRCLCPPGFNGSSCEITPCMMEPCNNGTCRMLSDLRYQCDCPPGFTGMHCETGKDIIWLKRSQLNSGLTTLHQPVCIPLDYLFYD